MANVLNKIKSALQWAQAQSWYPERKVIHGALAGIAASLVLALGLSTSPLVASLVAVLVAKGTAYLTKPRKADVQRAAKSAKK